MSTVDQKVSVNPLHPEFLRQAYRPKEIILPTPEEVDRFAAETVIEQVIQKPNSYITFATGGTPIGMYQLLAEAHRNGLSFADVVAANLDEYWPIDTSHPASYAQFMRDTLFSHIDIDPRNCHIPHGDARNQYEEAAKYQNVLTQLGKPDLTILGLGPGETCHIAFNGPGTSIDSSVHYVELDEETIEANQRFFGPGESVPTGALTQGVANILNAQKIMMIVKGEGKAWGVNRSLRGPISEEAPASLLRFHPDVTVIMDEEEASMLS